MFWIFFKRTESEEPFDVFREIVFMLWKWCLPPCIVSKSGGFCGSSISRAQKPLRRLFGGFFLQAHCLLHFCCLQPFSSVTTQQPVYTQSEQPRESWNLAVERRRDESSLRSILWAINNKKTSSGWAFSSTIAPRVGVAPQPALSNFCPFLCDSQDFKIIYVKW